MSPTPIAARRIGELLLPNDRPFIIAGPCVIESEAHALELGAAIRDIVARAGLPYIFKASFDKANRTSIQSYRGPGLREGLRILARVKAELGVPILTDYHDADQAAPVAEVADILQVPAFLCRQTDLILAGARTGRILNIKKGQFVAPWDLHYSVQKALDAGCERIWLTERGASFGYNNLVTDLRSLVIMRQWGWPVVFDATHSVQLPSGAGGTSGGQREFIEPLIRGAVAVGVDGVFMEVHEAPERALCDGPNALPLARLEAVLSMIKKLDQARREAAVESGASHVS
jgi:2-dehydro-3-deoxyphosphooctonate aldolase (KDO 8-P synthase)